MLSTENFIVLIFTLIFVFIGLILLIKVKVFQSNDEKKSGTLHVDLLNGLDGNPNLYLDLDINMYELCKRNEITLKVNLHSTTRN